MLVLSRKLNDKITIGDNIEVTVVRLEGNRVSIGISAPRDVRILRGELADAEALKEIAEFEISDREHAFAHPPTDSRPALRSRNRLLAKPQSQLFHGTVSANGSDAELSRATTEPAKSSPLSAYVSAT